jgi:DNA-binding MurR/RpiR family transcriptional regulator
VFLSAAELAERAGVSQPSVTRFAQAVGFAGYATFQHHLRSVLLPPPSAHRPSLNRYQLATREAIHNLEALEASLQDPEELRSLARSLSRSVPLVVLSVRVAAPIASYFSYFAARIHPDVRALNGGGSTALDGLSQARQAGATWAVCFLFPRYPQEMLAALSYARDLGFRVATVTDRASEPVSALSHILVPTGMSSRLLFGTVAAPIVYASVLLQAMADVAPRRTSARLHEFERMVRAQGVFRPEQG